MPESVSLSGKNIDGLVIPSGGKIVNNFIKKMIGTIKKSAIAILLAGCLQTVSAGQEAYCAGMSGIGCAVEAGTAAGPKKELKTVRFSVSMHCENCVRKITENISFEKGVKDLEISLEDKEVTVTYDPAKTDPDRLAEAIRSLGYTVERQKADDTVEKE